MQECETCTAAFWDQEACYQHMDSYGHWPECETCDNTFRTRRACDQHMNTKKHWAPRFKCETCIKQFASQHAAIQHMNGVKHWAPKIPCETCDKKFHNQQAAEQHMKSLTHYAHYCKDCDLRFSNENNLRMHLNSKVHRGANVPCPFCNTKFTTASGVAAHVGYGSCSKASNLHHDVILRVLHKRDPHSVITNRQIEWHEEVNVKYSATERAFNGVSWECYICHGKFRASKDLNAHLNSPVHRQKVYHCPNLKECKKQFTTLDALFKHLESESCSFMRFEKVQAQVENVFRGQKLIAFS
ncbi:hypothetical protein V8C42DRAFT_338026 [Trichoderma barbatum]